MIALVRHHITAEELARFRDKVLRLTQNEMAERLGVPYSRYKNWEYQTPIPPAIADKLLAMGYGRIEVGAPLIPASQLLIPIPFIGGVAASSPVDWTDPFESNVFEYVPPEMGDARGRFACRVLGDSMFDLLWPGDIAVFQKIDVPKLNAVVLFRSDDGLATIKTLKHDGERFMLHALNPGYNAEPARGTVVGYLVGIVREQGSRKVTVYDPSGIRE